MDSLIINADDFGLTSGVNAAVMKCVEAGSVSSATLMVSGEAASEAGELASQNERLGVGLHFNLTQGKPLTDPAEIPSIVNRDGDLVSRTRLLTRWLTGRLRREEIETEFKAQLSNFFDLCPQMSHIDSHQHVHMIPPVLDVITAHCREHNLPLRIPWVKTYDDVNRGFGRRLRSNLLRLLIRISLKKIDTGLRINRGFVSIFDICRSPEDISIQTYHRLISSIDDTPFEMMVHLSTSNDFLKKMTRISSYSEQEYRVLSQFNLGFEASKVGLHLTNYDKVS